MPLYEYQCQACQTVSEIHHKISDPAPHECPKCQGGPLKKLISKTAFVLKGSGWYTDGYSSASNKKAETAASGDTPAKSSAATASEGSTNAANSDTSTTASKKSD